MSKLADALFTTTQQQVLALLYGSPHRSFYTKEILRLTGMGVATIKRELDRMLAAGILTMTPIGNQHHYQANPQCPIYTDLVNIVSRTLGVVAILRQALAPMSEKIAWAFVYGSLASGRESSVSDVDVLVIGDVGFAEVVAALYSVQGVLGREVNPKLYSRQEWKKKVAEDDAFIEELLSKPRMDVIGSANVVGESGGDLAGESQA